MSKSKLGINFVSKADKSKSKIVQISGADGVDILHNLTTGNVHKFYEDPEVGQLHTCFLNSKGKIISDCFLVKPLVFNEQTQKASSNQEGEIWLQFARESEQELGLHLKKHSFRKKMKIDDISEQIDTLHFYVIFSSLKSDLVEF